jgi:hypothetical protein
MFIHDFITVRADQACALSCIAADGHALLLTCARDALDEGEVLASALSGGGTPRTPTLEVQMGRRYGRGGVQVIPMEWVISSDSSLLRRLRGDIEVGQLGAGRTQVGMSGTYEPALGSGVGALDRFVRHRLFETVMREFLSRVGRLIPGASLPPPASSAAFEVGLAPFQPPHPTPSGRGG